LHLSGTPYEWRAGHSPNNLPIACAPAWLLDLLSATRGATQSKPVNTNPAHAEEVLARKLAEVARAAEGTRNDTLNNAAFTLGKHIAVGALERGLVERALLAQAVEIGLPAREAESTLASGINAGFQECRAGLAAFNDRFGVEVKSNANGVSTQGRDSQPAEGEEAAFLPPEFSEDALALRFTERHGEDLRYVASWGRWLCWDGTRWREDSTLSVFDRARNVCRATASQCANKEQFIARRITAAQTVAAVERLARSDRRHAATVEQFDADPWLLNTPTGTVDLRTGKAREHCRGDFLTKLTGAGLARKRDGCPLWQQFLERVTGGDAALQQFLQRVAGYCLTGVTREHALFFLHGRGANGKGVFLNSLAGALGDYAKTAPIGTFLDTREEQHPTDLAGLCGARLVTAVETEDGRRWAEAKIKTLTGGDRIAARFMRQDFFEYLPQFKLLIAGNHKPGLRSVNEAMRRRLHLIPFLVTIPAEERDLDLAEKLRAEWPGILRWAVEGCLAWQDRGLDPPAAVSDATTKYLDAEDRIAAWIEDRCDLGPARSDTATALFLDWKSWAEAGGEKPGSQKAFSEKLQTRPGIEKTREGKARTRTFKGIALRAM
jgi:putative DNA primase/helicase